MFLTRQPVNQLGAKTILQKPITSPHRIKAKYSKPKKIFEIRERFDTFDKSSIPLHCSSTNTERQSFYAFR